MLKKDHLKSGYQVSTDQYECRLKGRFMYTKGKEDSKEILLGARYLLTMLQDLSKYITKSLWVQLIQSVAKKTVNIRYLI